MMFLIYFATRPEVRGRGYGSKILDMLRREFEDYRIFLVTEPLDPGAPDNEMRARRQAFYRRNGCRDTGVKVISDDAWFDTMYVQGALTEDEMVSVIKRYEYIHNSRS
jgi:GNAT superfamily N-acetyltransferase